MSCPGNPIGDSCLACELLGALESRTVFSGWDANARKSVFFTISEKEYEEFLQASLGKVKKEQ